MGGWDFFSYAKIEKVGACSEYINSHLALDHQRQFAKMQAKVSQLSFDISYRVLDAQFLDYFRPILFHSILQAHTVWSTKPATPAQIRSLLSRRYG
jgi:hypothetical protein